MGGAWSHKKTVVEDCLVLDIDLLLRRGSIAWGRRVSGTVEWRGEATGGWLGGADGGGVRCSVGFEYDGALSFGLSYNVAGRPIDSYAAPLAVSERRPFGGRRLWFLCPEGRRGLPRLDGGGVVAERNLCGRRVTKLYLPPGGERFACRRCHDLTYRSCQRSHCLDYEAEERGFSYFLR